MDLCVSRQALQPGCQGKRRTLKTRGGFYAGFRERPETGGLARDRALKPLYQWCAHTPHIRAAEADLTEPCAHQLSCELDCRDCATAFNMESPDGAVGISTAAVVAIVCNVLVAVLILVLFLILYKACKVPSSQERVPVLAPGNTQQKNEQKYLLTT
ncbi:hypothetical protein AOLI_G00208960 [Acnodon oligacanthus]